MMQSFIFAFDFICIILAGYMSWKQVHTYLQNDDFSEISFEAFSDGTLYNYPTYTICLEDNNLQQLYKTVQVKTHKNCSEDTLSSTCPYGCYIKKENEKLMILNKTNEEKCIITGPLNQYQDPFITDDLMPQDFDYVPWDYNNPLPIDYHSTGSENGPWLYDLGEYSTNETSTNLDRKETFVSIHEILDDSVHYDISHLQE